MGFRKLSNKEYEIQIDGRTRTIFVPFGKTELLFRAFILNGGIIDPSTGEVQNDLSSLMNSFKEVGNILLSEYDETGRLTREGNCFDLDYEDLLDLFQLATEIIANFIHGLTRMKERALTLSQESENADSPATTSKASQ